MLSFTTNGNFIDFKYTEDQYPFYVHQLTRLHNTSKCITWGYSDDTTRISFTIDDETYDNIPITSIYFDGVVMSAQADFKTNIESMFPGLAAGGTSYLLKSEIELTDAQIKALPTTAIEIVAAPGSGFMIMPTIAIFSSNCAIDYTNINVAATFIIRAGGGGTLMQGFNATDGSVNGILAPTAATGDTKGLGWIVSRQYTTGATGTETGMVTDIVSEYDNRNLTILIGNVGSGNLTGGNAANTLKIKVYYIVVTL